MTNLYAWKSNDDASVILYTTSLTPEAGDNFYDANGNIVEDKVIGNYEVADLSPFVASDTLSASSITCAGRSVTPI